MNVIEYALRLGGFLRQTPEGKELLVWNEKLNEKYKDNQDYSEYIRYVEDNTSRYYFYAWDMSYHTYLSVLDDENMEHRDFFLKTAEIVKSDDDIKQYAKCSVKFGNIFEELVQTIIAGDDVKNVMRDNWKYKIKNAIGDVQIGIERTLLIKELVKLGHSQILGNESSPISEYLKEREEKIYLPYSDKAREFMKEHSEISEIQKKIIEDMHLAIEVIKKGIFYGFWKGINIINEGELMEYDCLKNDVLKQVTFKHNAFPSDIINRGWLYKIELENKSVYFLANRKQLHFDPNNQYTEVTGIIYPSQDINFFENK